MVLLSLLHTVSVWPLNTLLYLSDTRWVHEVQGACTAPETGPGKQLRPIFFLRTFLFGNLGHTWQCPEITLEVFIGLYGMLKIEADSAECKVSTLPTVLSFWSLRLLIITLLFFKWIIHFSTKLKSKQTCNYTLHLNYTQTHTTHIVSLSLLSPLSWLKGCEARRLMPPSNPQAAHNQSSAAWEPQHYYSEQPTEHNQECASSATKAHNKLPLY